jgi:hypothetical protein
MNLPHDRLRLDALGFDRWFEERAGDSPPPGQSLARVTAVDRGAFHVLDQDGEVAAEIAGKFRFAIQTPGDMPCVGDWSGCSAPPSPVRRSSMVSCRGKHSCVVKDRAKRSTIK